MIHELKTLPQYFHRVFTGEKTFEVRKNDRDFQTGDVLILQEYLPEDEIYSGQTIRASVTYILQGGQFGIESGYCVLGIKVFGVN